MASRSRSCASKGFEILSTESRTSLFSGSIKGLAPQRKKRFMQCRQCTIKRKKRKERKGEKKENKERFLPPAHFAIFSLVCANISDFPVNRFPRNDIPVKSNLPTYRSTWNEGPGNQVIGILKKERKTMHKRVLRKTSSCSLATFLLYRAVTLFPQQEALPDRVLRRLAIEEECGARQWYYT